MNKFNVRTYKFNSRLLFKSAVALLLICFVLLKPIRAFIQDFSEDKMEFCMDTDETDTDEKDSGEKELEEIDDDQEDKFSIHSWIVLSPSSKNRIVNTKQNYSGEFHLGVLSPPPEIA